MYSITFVTLPVSETIVFSGHSIAIAIEVLAVPRAPSRISSGTSICLHRPTVVVCCEKQRPIWHEQDIEYQDAGICRYDSMSVSMALGHKDFLMCSSIRNDEFS